MNIIDILTTLIIPFTVFVLILCNTRKGVFQNILTLNSSTTLKAISCIIVVMVHFKEEHQNFMQDAIGSFAYIAVTIFFLLSGYGMSYSIERKKDYLKNFWRNRFSSIITPAVVTNILAFFILWICRGQANFKILLTTNTFVIVLSQFYILFYIIHKLTFISKNVKNYILISTVTASSLISYFCTPDIGSASIAFGWPWERMGLAWGIILYMFKDKIYTVFSKFTTFRYFALLLVGLILGIAYLKYKTVFFFGSYLLKLILGVTLISLVLQYLSNRTSTSTIINFIAGISYEIYLIHEISMRIIDLIIPNIQSGYFILLTYILTFILAYIVHLISKPIIKVIHTKRE